MKKIILFIMMLIAFNLQAKNYVWRNEGFINTIGETAISPDKKYFAETLTGSHGNIFKLFDLENKKLIFTIDSLSIRALSFSLDSKFCIYSQYELSQKQSYIKIYDIDNKIFNTIDTIPGVYKMIPLNNTKRLIYHYPDAYNNLIFKTYNWDLKKIENEIQLNPNVNYPNVNTDFALSKDGKKIIQSYSSPNQYRDSVPFNILYVYDIETNKQIERIQQAEKICQLLVTQDNKNIISVAFENTTRTININLNEMNTLDSLKSFKFSLEEYNLYNRPARYWLDNENLFLYFLDFGIIKINLTTGERIIDKYTNEKSIHFYPIKNNEYVAAFGNGLKFYKSKDSSNVLSEYDRIKFYEGKNHTDNISSVAITNDNKYVITGGNDKSFKFWDSENGNFIDEIATNTEIGKFVLSNDNNNIAWSSAYPPYKVILTKNTFLGGNKIIYESKTIISDFVFGKNDQYLIILDYNDTITVVNLANTNIINKYYYDKNLKSLKLSNNGKILAVSGFNSLSLINTETMESLISVPTDWAAFGIDFSKDDKRITFGCSDGIARILNTEDCSVENIYSSKTSIGGTTHILKAVISNVFFINTNQYLIGNVAGFIKFWDINSPDSYFVYEDFYKMGYLGDYYRVNSFAKSSDEKFIVSIARNGDIVKWNMPQNTSVELEAESISISPNPASDYIEISLDSPSIKRGLGDALSLSKWGVSFEIFNIFGEKCTSTDLSREESGKVLPTGEDLGGVLKIDISNLPAGVYFVRIGDRFEKFVKL